MDRNAISKFYNNFTDVLALAPQVPIVVVSPHIDDAVWSLGPVLKALADRGHTVRLVNLFSISLIVGDEHALPAESTAIRKAEDALAAQAVGFTEVVYLDFPDGILRDHELETVFDPAYKAPEWFTVLLGKALKQQVADDAVVLAPSGFGWHIDHQLAARAASQLEQKVIFYEDLPYAARAVRVHEAKEFLPSQGAHEVRVPADTEVIAQHLDLYRLYASQRAQHHEEQISTHLTANGYGFWR